MHVMLIGDIYFLKWEKKKLTEGVPLQGVQNWFKESKKKLRSMVFYSNEAYFVRPYNLACIYAINGKDKKCKRLLKECYTQWSLKVGYQRVLEDEDFKNVRETRWFKKLIKKWQEVPNPSEETANA